MKTLKLKWSEASEGRLSLQNPLAELGRRGPTWTIEITGIPDEIPAAAVLRLADRTTIFGPGFSLRTAPDSVPYSALGVGRIYCAPEPAQTGPEKRD